MKKIAKSIIVTILGWQIRRLRKKYNPFIIGVAGSIGKTSTKTAIATVLKQTYKVRYQEGNYNDLVSVPLVFFDEKMPSLFNPFAWAAVLVRNEHELRRRYEPEIVVVELGTDGPGQIKQFAKYLRLDLGVLTAITPEHMEFFRDIAEVADEEMNIAVLSEKLLVNRDLCPEEYTAKLPVSTLTYSVRQASDYQLTGLTFTENAYNFKVLHGNATILSANHESIAETQLYSLCAAIAVANEKQLTPEQIEAGIREVKPVAGRMQRLKGIDGSLIIDDTYNASPVATKAALDTLYKLNAPQKIALLGNMNELGSYSREAHTEVGEYCDPHQLDWVVTLGPDANQYLASAAKRKGCKVQTFNDPYSAGEFIKQNMKSGAVVLAKGSQNGVFAEEAVKLLLADPNDQTKLVRQSKDWINIKRKQFTKGKHHA